MKAQLKRHIAGRFMTKLLATLALAVGFATAAQAATPVAVWDGDFTTLTKQGWSIGLNGNARANGVLTIGAGNNGILVTNATAKGTPSIIVRYANLTRPATTKNGAVLVTLAKSLTGVDQDYLGIASRGTDGISDGLFQNKYWHTSSSIQTANVVPESGVFGFAYTRTSKTDFYVRDAEQVTVFSSNGMKASGDSSATFFGFSLGGMRNEAETTNSGYVYAAATGLRITGIAVFETTIGEADVAAFKFPSEYAVKIWGNAGTATEGGVTAAGSSLNFATVDGSHPLKVNFGVTNNISQRHIDAYGQVRITKFRLAARPSNRDGDGYTPGGLVLTQGSRSETATNVVKIADGQAGCMTIYKPDGTVFATRAVYEFAFAGEVGFDASADISFSFRNASGADFASTGCTLVQNLVNSTMKWSDSYSPIVEISGVFAPRRVLSVNMAQYWNGNNGSTTDNPTVLGQVTTDQTTLLGTVPADAWAQSGVGNIPAIEGSGRTSTFNATKILSGTKVAENTSATRVRAYFSAGTNLNRVDDFANTFRYTFLTAYNTNKGNGDITVSNVPFDVYDAIIYMASSSTSQMNPVSVNGTYLTPTAMEGVNTTATGAENPKWGDGKTAAFAYGTNVMRVNGLSGDLTILHTADDWGIAAVQLVEHVSKATIPANANIRWSDITWDGAIPETAADAVRLTLAGDATITVDAAAACGAIEVGGTGTLTLIAYDNLTSGKITSGVPLVLTTAKNQAVDAGANDLVYNYTGAAMSGTVPSVTCTGNLTLGGSSELKWTATVDTGKTLTVAGTCKVYYYGNSSQCIKGTVVIGAGATFVNKVNNDVLQYSGSPVVNVYGTLDMSDTRWTVRGANTIRLFPGGRLIGAGHATHKAIDLENAGSANTVKFDLGDAASGTATVTAGFRDRSAAPSFEIPANMTVEFGSAFSAEYSTARKINKTGTGALKLLPSLGIPGHLAVNVAAGVLDLTAMTEKTAATQIPGNLTMGDAVAVRFPAGFSEDDTFTLCGGTLTASAKVRNAVVYIGDSATPVENATLVYDTANKTVAYTTSTAGSVTISGDTDIAGVIAAVGTAWGSDYADDVMVTMDAGATLTVDATFAYPKLTIVNAGAAVIDYQLHETDTFAKIDLVNVAGALTITTSVKVPVDAGARDLTYNYNGADAITSDAITTTGVFTKGGTGTMNVNFGSGRTAATFVTGGMLAYNATAALGSNPNVTVNAGATLDFNGFPNNQGAPAITLAGGTLKNGVNQGGGTGQMQLKTLTLTADSTIDTPYEFGLIGSSYAATMVTLDTYTLTKKGDGAFHLANATVGGTGKIRVEAGELDVFKASTFTDGTLELAGGTLRRTEAFTVGNVLVTADSTLVGNAALTTTLTVSDEAKLTCTGVTYPLAGVTLAATQDGTVKVTTPGIATKVALAADGLTGLILAGTDGSALLSCVYDGGFWYGQTGGTYTLTDDDKSSISNMAPGGVFTKPTTYVDLANVGGTPDGYFAWYEGKTAYVAKKSDSISIKFGPRGANTGTIGTTDAALGGYPVAGKFWNHSKIYADNNNPTTEIFALKDGNGETLDGVLCYYYAPNTYNNGNGQTTGNGKLTKTYFDDPNRATPSTWPYSVGTYEEREYFLPATPTTQVVTANLRWEVAITNIPYQVFDLYLYQASDQTGSSIKLMSLAVKANDGEWKYFAGDNAGSTVPAAYDTVWNGAPYCNDAEMVEGTHYIRYRLSKAALGLGDEEEISVIYLSHPKTHDKARLGLAGVQIVLVENDGYYTRKTDAASNDWLADGTWINSSKKEINWANPSGKDVAYATIDADEVTTINIDGTVVANEVKLVNTETGTFTFTRTNEGTLAAPIDATGFHGKIVTCDGMTSAIALGDASYIEVNVPAGTTVALENILPAGITIVGGSIKIVGEGTVVCDGAFPTAYQACFQNADAWHGTVWIKNVQIKNGENVLAKYGNANSKVKVTGVYGYQNTAGNQGVTELVLADSDETLAFEINDTSSGWTYSYDKFTGNGTFKFATIAATAAGVAIADVSDFTGALLSTPGMHRDGATTARPIYVGTTTATAGTASLISVADGATVNSGCGWQAASVAFGSTLVVKGTAGDTLVTGITTAPTLNTEVTLKDRTTGETAEGTHCLVYDASAGAVKVFKYVTFELPSISGAESVTVTGGTLAEGTVKAYVGQTLTLTYTADEGKLFNDGAATKTVTVSNVTTGEAAKSAVDAALEGVTTADAKAKIGTQLYLTFAAAVAAANDAETAEGRAIVLLADATVDAEMAVSNTVTFTIADGLTLTLRKGGFSASQFTNNGTIAIDGGTAEAPIALTGNADFGVMTLAAGAYVKNTVDGNHTHIVTGAGASSFYALGKASGGVGFTAAAFTNLTLVSDCVAGERVWIERLTLKDVGFLANTTFYLSGVSPTVVSLAGTGSVTRAGSETLTVACAAACEYAGASSVPFTVGGTETLTLSGAYAGALTVNADAQIVLAVAADATKTISGTVTGAGNIATSGTGTLVLSGDASGFEGVLTVASGLTVWASESWLTDGKLKFTDASSALAVIDQTSFDGTVEIELADASAQPGSVSVTSVTAPEHDFGTVTVTGAAPNLTVKYTPWVSGKGAKYAWEFNGSLASTGRDTSSMGKDHGPYYTDEADGIYAYSQPYSGLTWPTEFTTAIACTLPTNANVCLIGWGQASPGGIALISGDVTKNEVKMVYWQNNQEYTVLKTMTVPNAFDCEHLYLFSKTADGVKVYLDGSLVVNYTGALSIGVGVQVGTVYQGVGSTGIRRLDTVYSGTNVCKAVVNSLRVYDAVLGPNAIAELKKEFPYTSPHGTYSRALRGTENTWDEADTWTKIKEGEEQSEVAVPAENATVELSAAENATVSNNLSASAMYEAVNLSGEGTISIAAADDNANKITTSALKVGASAVIEYSAMDLANTPIEITTGNTLTIDASMIDVSWFYSSSTIVLTGLVTADNESTQLVIVPPAAVAGRTVSVEKNGSTGQYELKIAVKGGLTVTIAANATTKWSELDWKMGEDSVVPDWTAIHAAPATVGENAVLELDVTFAGETTLSVDNDLAVFKTASGSVANLTLAPATGKMVDVYVAEGEVTALPCTINGTIGKTGAGTLAVSVHNRTFQVKAGTLKSTEGGATGSVTVDAGAVFDVNGRLNTTLTVVLNGGKLVNNGDGIGVTKKQYASIALTADSSVGGSGNLEFVSGSYAKNTLTLNGHTLTKEGGNAFTLCNTTVTNGAVVVASGTLKIDSYNNNPKAVVFIEATLTVNEGATLEIVSGQTLTVPTIACAGTLTNSGALRITESVSYGMLGSNVTLADGVTVRFPAGVTQAKKDLVWPTGGLTVDAAPGAGLEGTFAFPKNATFTPAFTTARKAAGYSKRTKGNTIEFIQPFMVIIR